MGAGPSKRLWLTPHLIMCITGFSYLASSSVATPILSIYVKEAMNAPVEIIGLVTSVFFVVSAVTRIFLEFLAGGMKIISFLLLAFVILSICPAFYPFVDSVSWLIFLRSAQGFASAFIGTASLILAALTIPEAERDRGVGTYTASLSLGLLAGPAITTVSIPLFGVPKTFYFASLMGVIGISSTFILYRRLSSIERDWQITDVTVDKEPLKSKLAAIARNRMFGVSFVGNIAFFLLFGVILAYAPLHAKENLNFNDDFVSVLFLLYYIATTATRFSAGRIVDKVAKPTLVAIATASAALLSLALGIFSEQLLFAGAFAMIGAVQGILIPVSSMLVADHIQPSRSALANSLYVMGMDVGQAVAPLMMAGVVIRYGLEYGFIVSAAVSLVATLIIIWLKAHR